MSVMVQDNLVTLDSEQQKSLDILCNEFVRQCIEENLVDSGFDLKDCVIGPRVTEVLSNVKTGVHLIGRSGAIVEMPLIPTPQNTSSGE